MTTVAGCRLTVAAVAPEKMATKHCTAIATDGLHMVIGGKKSFTGDGVSTRLYRPTSTFGMDVARLDAGKETGQRRCPKQTAIVMMPLGMSEFIIGLCRSAKRWYLV